MRTLSFANRRRRMFQYRMINALLQHLRLHHHPRRPAFLYGLKVCFTAGLHFCGSKVGGDLNQRGLQEMGLVKFLQMLICHIRLLAAKWWMTARLTAQKYCHSQYMLPAAS